VVDLEHLVTPVLDRLELNIDRDALASDDDVGETVVRPEGPARLASEGKSDVANVALALREAEAEAVVVGVEAIPISTTFHPVRCHSRLVDVVVWRESKLIVRLNVDDVGEEVGPREDEVLDDNGDLVVLVLGSGNGDVALRN
jgi:hypothetical protein